MNNKKKTKKQVFEPQMLQNSVHCIENITIFQGYWLVSWPRPPRAFRFLMAAATDYGRMMIPNSLQPKFISQAQIDILLKSLKILVVCRNNGKS